MKAVGLLLSLFLLGSCAPEAMTVEEPETPVAPPTPVREQAAEPPPPEEPEDLGLLEPAGLLGMPDERDMEATAAEQPGAPVIANPPEDGAATSE